MPIAAQGVIVERDGDGAVTTFAYDRAIELSSHLRAARVDADGTPTALLNGTDFSVTVAVDLLSASVTYPLTGDPLPTGEKLRMWREEPINQGSDFAIENPYRPARLTAAVDKLTRIAQQLEYATQRALGTAADPLGEGALAEIATLTARVQALEAANAAAAAAIGGLDTDLADLQAVVAALAAAIDELPVPFGEGQMWQQFFSPAREKQQWYQNTSGRSIAWSVRALSFTSDNALLRINSVASTTDVLTPGGLVPSTNANGFTIVPDGWFYQLENVSQVNQWWEYR